MASIFENYVLKPRLQNRVAKYKHGHFNEVACAFLIEAKMLATS